MRNKSRRGYKCYLKLKIYLLFNYNKMYSQNLNKYFETKCDPDNFKSRLESIFCSIDPKYLPDFENYRNSILNTLKNWSQI